MRIKLPKYKHKVGYTNDEIENIIRIFDINMKKFKQKLGIATCGVDAKTNEILVYKNDITKAIELCLENRERLPIEFD